MNIHLRPSQAKNWQACSKMAAHHALLPIDDSTTHVGAYVGNLVHAKLTGHVYTEPQFIVFDEVTRNRQEAQRHADALFADATLGLDNNDLEVERREVSMKRTVTVGEADVTVEGSLDLVCRQVRGKSLALLDLKTGRRPPASVFVQIALYAWLWDSRALERGMGRRGRLPVRGEGSPRLSRTGAASRRGPADGGGGYHSAVRLDGHLRHRGVAWGALRALLHPGLRGQGRGLSRGQERRGFTVGL